jgi:hypothetical protein
MYIRRTSPCAADNNELEAFDVSDIWCCYVGNENELHVLISCFTEFLLGLVLRATHITCVQKLFSHYGLFYASN